jgi:hypothetical protein
MPPPPPPPPLPLLLPFIGAGGPRTEKRPLLIKENSECNK